MENLNKVCKSCNKEFTVSIQEQEFLLGVAEKMASEGKIESIEDFVMPERCVECRRQRRRNK